MAKAHGIYKISGKIYNHIFRVRDGQQLVHLAPYKVRVPKDSVCYHLNRQEFGGAAKLAGYIYRFLQDGREDQELGPIFCPYPQNKLTARIRNQAVFGGIRNLDRRPAYLDHYRFHQVHNALMGCDLSRGKAAAAKIQMIPLGPQHSPTAIKVLGLDKAALAIPVHGNAHLEFRFIVRQTAIPDFQYHEGTKEWKQVSPDGTPLRDRKFPDCARATPSDWIPVEIVPREGITFPIHQWKEGARYLTAVMIEWREVRSVGRRIHPLHEHGIVRLATVHAPAEAYISPADTKQNLHPQACHHVTPKSKSLKRPKHWREDPKAFLTQALGKMQV